MNKLAPILAAALLLTALQVRAQSTPAAAAAGPAVYMAAGAATRPVADAYFAAYFARDWARLEPLLADDVSLNDPTATLLFGAGGGAIGKTQVMTGLRTVFAGVKAFDFRQQRALYSGNFAIYEGDLDMTIDMRDGRDVSSTTPMVVVLEVKDGKIFSHRDYVDYAPFVLAERANRPPRK